MKTIKTIGILVSMILSFSALAQPWSVNASDYQFSMTVTGNVYIEENVINQQDVYIGAFVNGECRGISTTSEQDGDNKVFYLSVYSNQTEGDTIFFKFMDENSVEFNIANYILFKNDAYYGLNSAFLWMDDPMYGTRDFLSFELDSQITEAIIDREDKTISIMVTRNTDLTNLTPTFTLAPEANAYIDQTEQISAQSTNDYSNPIHYIVKGINNRDAYWTVEVKFDDSGIKELEQTDFSIYPNPAKNYIIIENNEQLTKNCTIFDITGKEIKQYTIQNAKLEIRISDLKKGIYFVKIENLTKKLIIE